MNLELEEVVEKPNDSHVLKNFRIISVAMTT